MRALSLLVAAATAAAAQDDAATAALRKLAERLKDAKTLSAKVTQTRKTALLEKPIVSSGTLYYRREPARLVFRLAEPRATEIHLDPTTYQVYRPDEKRLERFEFDADAGPGRLFMVFRPKAEEIGKAFAIRKGESKEGSLEVVLEPADDKVRRRVTRIVLTIGESDGTLKRIATTDPDGDEVSFDLSDLRINPELDASTFELRVPEGTRVLRHEGKLEK